MVKHDGPLSVSLLPKVKSKEIAREFGLADGEGHRLFLRHPFLFFDLPHYVHFVVCEHSTPSTRTLQGRPGYVLLIFLAQARVISREQSHLPIVPPIPSRGARIRESYTCPTIEGRASGRCDVIRSSRRDHDRAQEGGRKAAIARWREDGQRWDTLCLGQHE